jgi:hypothetical protein
MNKDSSLAIAGYIAISAICTYPLIFKLNSLYGPPSDNQLFIWNFWWFKQAIFHLHTNPFFTKYLFYPDGINLFFRISPPLNGILAILLEPIFGFFGSYNILVLFSFIVGSFGCYKLAQFLGFSNRAAFIAGVVYSINPYHLYYGKFHLNVVSVELIPFLVLYTLKALKTNSKKAIIVASILLAGCFYLDCIPFIFACASLIALMFFNPYGYHGKAKLGYLKTILIVLVGGCALTTPISIPMFFEAVGSCYINPGGYDKYISNFTGYLSFGKPYFLGYFVLPLAIFGALRKGYPLRKYFISLFSAGIVLALGSHLHVGTKIFNYIVLPYYIIEHIPILNAARVPERFIFLSFFAMSLFAAAATESILDWAKSLRKPAFLYTVVPVITLAIMANYFYAPMEMTKIEPPAFYQTLQNEPADYAILNLPLLDGNGLRRYMYYQTVHGKPICGGLLARYGLAYYADIMKANFLTADYLTSRKFKYVILHKEFIGDQDYKTLRNTLGHQFTLVAEEGGESLYRAY